MANSRDNDDASGKPLPQWPDWLAHFQRTAGAPAGSGEATDAAWRAAIDSWWQGFAAVAPPQARELLKPALDQGLAFMALAGAIAAPRSTASGEDLLWRQPLRLWEQAAARVLDSGSGSRPAGAAFQKALGAYQRALREYVDALRDVSARALTDVADAWPARRTASAPDGALRALFDLYVDMGEHRYHELVASEKFAELGGRLINSLVECVRYARVQGAMPAVAEPVTTASPDPEAPRSPALPGLLAELGFEPERTLAELQAFGDKLNVGVETLRDLGAIDVGTSPKEAVLHEGKVTLYRYVPAGAPTNPVPVLIVYALANRPYMMDLQPQRSLIRGLMEMGLEVYLIDWGYPDGEDAGLSLDSYVNGFIDACVDKVRERHAVDGVNLLGVCQGGTFTLCYAALHAHKVRNLVLMVTPVDFHTPDNLLTTWLRHVDVDRLVDVLGNVPGELLNWAFVSLKPLRLTGQKYLDMVNVLDDQEKARTFLRMEKWIHDSPAQAGECFRQFTKDLFQQNKLIKGTLKIGGRIVDLREVTMPVLNVYATQDHIVPPQAALGIEGRIASEDYTSFAFEGGHIGIYVSAKAQREVPQKIAEWLHARCDSVTKTSP